MNYSEIKAAALAYADRSDNDVTERFDTFLRMFESRINRVLKTREMAVRATHIAVSGREYYGLPSDYAGIRDIEIYTPGSTTRETLARVNPEQLNNITDTSCTYYTIIADQFQIKPSANLEGKTIEIIYYQKVPELSETATTNWLADTAPDCYICGALVEISSYLKDIDGVTLWQQRYAEASKEIEQNDYREQWSGTPMTIRVG